MKDNMFASMLLPKKKKSYKETHDLASRISESNRILAKYPDHIPIIVDCHENVGEVKKSRFLVVNNVSVSYLLCSIRKQMTTQDATQGLFLFCGTTLVSPTKMICEVYEEYQEMKRKDTTLNKEELRDKFLYLELFKDNVFGI